MANTRETMKYGVNVHGKPYYSSRDTWRRLDTYTSNETGETVRELHFAAGPIDDSNLYSGSVYDSDCSCCWLNFSHTVDSHNRSVRLAKEAKADYAERMAHCG